MVNKNRACIFIHIIFLCILSFIANAGHKDKEIVIEKANKRTKASGVKSSLSEEEYLAKQLLIHEELPCKSSFNLSKPEQSPINLGCIGMKGFPLLHPYEINDEKDTPEIHLVADLEYKYVKVPTCVYQKLGRKLNKVKVVIMSAPWEKETLYRPHYMLHSALDYRFELTTLVVTVAGSDVDEQMHFSGGIAVDNHMVFSFLTYLSLKDTIYFNEIFSAEPDNATIVFPLVKNIGAINNGSFWILHKGDDEKVTATFFWIINDRQLKSELKKVILKPGQTWKGLMQELRGSKWGSPAKCLRKMSNIKKEHN